LRTRLARGLCTLRCLPRLNLSLALGLAFLRLRERRRHN
jgi:hypothetical protein